MHQLTGLCRFFFITNEKLGITHLLWRMKDQITSFYRVQFMLGGVFSVHRLANLSLYAYYESYMKSYLKLCSVTSFRVNVLRALSLVCLLLIFWHILNCFSDFDPVCFHISACAFFGFVLLLWTESKFFDTCLPFNLRVCVNWSIPEIKPCAFSSSIDRCVPGTSLIVLANIRVYSDMDIKLHPDSVMRQ